MTVETWCRLLIDRIHMSVAVGDKELYSFALSQLFEIKGMQKELLPNGNIVIKKEKYLTQLTFCPTKSRSIAQIEIGTTKTKHKYFKLSLFPSQFQPGEFNQFKEILGLLLPDFNYAKLFHTSRVSYLELAVDTLSHDAHTFIPFRDHSSVGNIVIDSLSGKKGTTYIGSRLSALSFCIYDKRKQLIATNQPAKYSRQTRIEARLKHTGLPPAELLKIENPFIKLHIADPKNGYAVSDEKNWHQFLDLCFEFGCQRALAMYPKKRLAYKKQLNAALCPWWKPASVWTGLAAAMNAIAP